MSFGLMKKEITFSNFDRGVIDIKCKDTAMPDAAN